MRPSLNKQAHKPKQYRQRTFFRDISMSKQSVEVAVLTLLGELSEGLDLGEQERVVSAQKCKADLRCPDF